MTAAGEAVLAVAYGEVGYVEGPNNSTKYWDWYGGNYGPWCGVFCMWCSDQAGYPVCADTVLVSNGTVHGYTTGGSGATGVEAQTTLDLQPGDFVLFSWEPWEFRNGVPTCVGAWDGYPAGDHIGVFAYWVDQGAGRFAAVEGNTSSSSYDNGGMVLLREDRYTSQACGWWRQEAIASGGGPGPGPDEEDDLTPDQDQLLRDIYNMCTWINTNAGQTNTVIMSNDIAAVNFIRDTLNMATWTNGTAQNTEAVARATYDNTVRLLDGDAPPAPEGAAMAEPVATADEEAERQS